MYTKIVQPFVSYMKKVLLKFMNFTKYQSILFLDSIHSFTCYSNNIIIHHESNQIRLDVDFNNICYIYNITVTQYLYFIHILTSTSTC